MPSDDNELDLNIPAIPKEPYAKRLTLKYGKRCVECNNYVAAGEIGYWNKRTSEIFCEDCGEQL